jgi:tRNA threonylcarbamoyl adenosine modification protein YjeE
MSYSFDLSKLPVDLETLSLAEFKAVAKAFAKEHLLTHDKLFVLLYGDLGVGKTEWVKSCLEHFNPEASQIVTSPTYTYHHRYKFKDSGRFKQSNSTDFLEIDHFDLYRLNNFEKIESLGIFDLILESKIAFIEWPEEVESSLKTLKATTETLIRVKISSLDSTCSLPLHSPLKSNPNSAPDEGRRQIQIF